MMNRSCTTEPGSHKVQLKGLEGNWRILTGLGGRSGIENEKMGYRGCFVPTRGKHWDKLERQ